MNTILLPLRQEIEPGKFVIPFTCSDIAKLGIRTELSRFERSESENKVLDTVWDRITLALLERGFEVQTVNLSSMTITATAK
jgi:hypothetical protein